MATNKHALIRYKALDRCFRSKTVHTIKMLLEECNRDLLRHDDSTEGIKRRQLYDDIKFMKSEEGWKVDLVVSKKGKEATYAYADKTFSINSTGLSEIEAAQMKEAVLILSRFKGMPQFGWIDEVVAKFESSFGLKKGTNRIIGFDENKNYTGIEHISVLFNAIFKETALKILYQDYKHPEPYSITVLPCYLKQYNNRWFCFVWDKEKKKLSNLALDRIRKIKPLNQRIERPDINFEDYFKDIVGVTLDEKSKLEKITIKVDKKHWPYIESKPLHNSQIPEGKDGNAVIISIMVRPNYELESLILSHGEKLEIVSPLSFKNRIMNRVNAIK